MNLVSLLAGYISMRKYRKEFYKPSLLVVSCQFARILLVRRHRKLRSATGRDLTVICYLARPRMQSCRKEAGYSSGGCVWS